MPPTNHSVPSSFITPSSWRPAVTNAAACCCCAAGVLAAPPPRPPADCRLLRHHHRQAMLRRRSSPLSLLQAASCDPFPSRPSPRPLHHRRSGACPRFRCNTPPSGGRQKPPAPETPTPPRLRHVHLLLLRFPKRMLQVILRRVHRTDARNIRTALTLPHDPLASLSQQRPQHNANATQRRH